MNGEQALERRYRRLLHWYPAAHRRAFGDEMLGVLMASVPPGTERPGRSRALDLIRGGVAARFGAGGRALARIDWRDALAVCSVVVPVVVASYLVTQTAMALTHSGFVLAFVRVLLIDLLLLAVPSLLALRWPRIAVVPVLGLIGLATYGIYVTLLGPGHWSAGDGEMAGLFLALLLQAIAFACSAGPRRAIRILTARAWLVLIAAGVAVYFANLYLPNLPIWLSTAIVIAGLALFAAAMLATIPRPAVTGALLLLAIPAYPGAIASTNLAGPTNGSLTMLPDQLLLPLVALIALVATIIWRTSRGRRPAGS